MHYIKRIIHETYNYTNQNTPKHMNRYTNTMTNKENETCKRITL